MASVEDIQEVKHLAYVPLEAFVVADEDLEVLVDAKGINGSVAHLWTRYASSLAGLVDVSESGSSRKLGDLHKNALAIAKTYTDLSSGEVAVATSSPRTRAIVRP